MTTVPLAGPGLPKRMLEHEDLSRLLRRSCPFSAHPSHGPFCLQLPGLQPVGPGPPPAPSLQAELCSFHSFFTGAGRAGGAREAGGPRSHLFSLSVGERRFPLRRVEGANRQHEVWPAWGMQGTWGVCSQAGGGHGTGDRGPGAAPRSCAGCGRKEAGGDRKGAFPSRWVSLCGRAEQTCPAELLSALQTLLAVSPFLLPVPLTLGHCGPLSPGFLGLLPAQAWSGGLPVSIHPFWSGCTHTTQ